MQFENLICQIFSKTIKKEENLLNNVHVIVIVISVSYQYPLLIKFLNSSKKNHHCPEELSSLNN